MMIGPKQTDSPRPSIPAALQATRIVAILRHTDAHLAVQTAEALVRGGVTVIEVTLNTPGALGMLAAIRTTLGDRVTLGAGTVLDVDAAQAALAAGAQFIVSPHANGQMINHLVSARVLCVPGAFTATEVLTAWQMGASLVKVFPVGSVGPTYVKDLRGPLAAIPLLPTGGVTLDNAAAFIAAGAWGLGLGSALVDPREIAQGRFDELSRRAAAFVDIVAGRASQ